MIGLDDSTILHSINETNEHTDKCTVNRAQPIKIRRYSIVHIAAASFDKCFDICRIPLDFIGGG